MSDELPEPTIDNPDETPIMMPSTPEQDEEKKKKRKDFWLGVGLWCLLNILVFPLLGIALFALTNAISTQFIDNTTIQSLIVILTWVVNFIPFVVNVGLMIYFVVIKRQQVAFGMLAAFGVSLLIVVCLGVIFMAVCFVSLSGGIGG